MLRNDPLSALIRLSAARRNSLVHGGRTSAGLFVAVASVLAVALSACGSSTTALRSVHMGMSENTVRSILGKPTAFQNSIQAGTVNTCWYYKAEQVVNGPIYRYQVCFKNGTVAEKAG